ncbi:MAG TPA: hypothetical protein VFC44_04985, partial [Candidatus Saccharimonadales bacterium]|nr:hypothetical protein [Candidatus Saccharimonadales bacterium]
RNTGAFLFRNVFLAFANKEGETPNLDFFYTCRGYGAQACLKTAVGLVSVCLAGRCDRIGGWVLV